MNGGREGDERLREAFRTLREEEVGGAPSFSALMARARSEALAEEAPARARPDARDPLGASTPAAPPARVEGWAPRRHPWIRWLPPLAAAAAVAAILLSGGRSADREFDRLVGEWSRTSRVALHSPTDRLLAVPGAQFLRSVPLVGAAPPAPTSSQRSRP